MTTRFSLRSLGRPARLPAAALSLTLLAACGTTMPPGELVAARSAYQRASAGPAMQYVPTAVHEAKTSLEQAESSFQRDGDSARTKDLAYVAQRKAELAETKGSIGAAEHSNQQARADLQQKLVQIEGANRGELNATRDQISREQTAREQADRAARASSESAARIAAEKANAKGDVNITGSVLFGPGESILTPIAQEKLTQAAQALRENESVRVTVEGHTDNTAKEKKGDLARRRAEVVRDFLVSKGVPSERVHVMGMGSSRPAADNKTVEGRANNRRVELIPQR